jgi:hypothetical protein
LSKSYKTVVNDIYALFEKKGFQFNPENISDFGQRLAQHIANRVAEERGPPSLRFSNIGKKCNRALWYQINEPYKAEPLSPQVQFKFLYGDIIEELVLFLAKEAGHRVEGQQDELNLEGLKGHRDAILDGLPIDVKSASSRTLDKFKEGLREDPFGYREQLSGYEKAAQGDPRVTEKGSAFLVVDKTTGEIYLDHHDDLKDIDLKNIIKEKKEAVSRKEPPPRYYMPEPEGKSGNLKLGVECSYCPFKEACWPGLRTFLYANKPVFLTRVERLPKVPEASKEN